MDFIDTKNYNEGISIADACIVNLDEIKEETKDKIRKDGFIVGVPDNLLMKIDGIARPLTYDEYKYYANVNPNSITHEEYVNYVLPIKRLEVPEDEVELSPIVEQLNIQSLKELIAQSDNLEN